MFRTRAFGDTRQPSLGKFFRRKTPHRPVIDDAVPRQLAPEKQIFRDRQRFGEQDLLVDEGDAGILRLARAWQTDRRSPSIANVPAVGST